MPKVHITKNYRRYRQKSPKRFDKRSFRVKQVSKKTKIILACPKGKWSPKTNRCKGNMQVQSILKKKK